MNPINVDAMITMAKSKAQSLRDQGNTMVADAQAKANVLFDQASVMDGLITVLPTLPPMEPTAVVALHDLVIEACDAQ